MAKSLEPTATLCLEWITDVPLRSTSRRSHSFLLLGAKWHLRFACEFCPWDNFCYYWILLNREAEIQPSVKEFYVSTYVDDRKLDGVNINSETPFVAITLVNYEKKLIWSCSSKDLSNKRDMGCGTRRVVCVFHGVASTAFEQDETVHLSSQPDAKGSTASVDKYARPSIESLPHLERLSDDYSDLLEKEIFPDVNLNCAGQTRSVHRSILAARSEVFSAMFRNRMLESETGSVDVKDLDASVLDMLLKYLYSGKIPDFCDDTAASLYEASDKYAVGPLKEACSDWMIRNMTEENCVIFLNMADAHSDGEFKDTVVKFIHDHPKIFKSNVWSVCLEKNLKLASEVMKNYIVSITK